MTARDVDFSPHGLKTWPSDGHPHLASRFRRLPQPPPTIVACHAVPATLRNAFMTEQENTAVPPGTPTLLKLMANRIPGIRCAVCWNVESANLARRHNDANVISLGQRMMPLETALQIVRVWLREPLPSVRKSVGAWSKNLPITRQVGPAMPNLVIEKGIFEAVRKTAAETLRKNVAHETDFLLKRQEARRG